MSRAVERVLDVFEALGGEPAGLSLSELARRLQAPKGSLHPIVRSLLARGYLTRRATPRRLGAGESGALRLGMSLWSVGASVVDDLDLVAIAQPVMRRTADELNESVQLSVLDGTHNVYIAREDSAQPVQLISRVGRRLHAHATGLGKMLLSGVSDEEVRRRFGPRALPRFTPHTLPDAGALCAELGRIRERGYATDDEEYTPGIRCIAVPIRDHASTIVAAMSVSVPTFRLGERLRERALALLPAAAAEISTQLGWLPHRRSRTERTEEVQG